MTSTLRPTPQIFAFGAFELDVATGELRKEGRLIHLRHQPVQVMHLLLERAGALVTRAEIISALWPDDLDVDVEQGLNHCVKEIRAAIGDRADSPRFIQTLSRRGYRFLGVVRDLRTSGDREPANGAALGFNSHPAATAVGSAEARGLLSPGPAPKVMPGGPESAAGDQGVRVRVKLVIARSADDAVLWSETYERRSGELDRLERDLTKGIRAGMQAATTPAEDPGPAGRDPEAPRRDQRFE